MSAEGISFLHYFDLGNRDYLMPGSKILSVTSTADGDFDKSNLTTESIRHVWRSANVLASQDIVIEADQASNIDTFAILGHNFSPTAVVKIQANISDNWLAPPVSLTIPWSKGNMVLTQTFGSTYSHYRLRILDTANPCGYVQIGRIVGGRAVTLTANEDITDDFVIANKDMAELVKTEGFFRVATEKVKVRTLKAKFQKLRTSVAEADGVENFVALREMFDHVGSSRPFLVIIDRYDPSFCSLWGQFDDVPDEQFTLNRYVTMSLSITEMF